jgi:hypothetical protein
MVSGDDEVTLFQHMTEILHVLVDSQQLWIVGAEFLNCWEELLGEECEWLSGVVDTLLQEAPMAETEASVTSASDADGSVWAGAMARVTNSPSTLHWPCRDPASTRLDERTSLCMPKNRQSRLPVLARRMT